MGQTRTGFRLQNCGNAQRAWPKGPGADASGPRFRTIDERVEQGGTAPVNCTFTRVFGNRRLVPILFVDGSEKTFVVAMVAQSSSRKTKVFGQTGTRCPVYRHEAIGPGKCEQSCRDAGTNSTETPTHEVPVGFEGEFREGIITGGGNIENDVLNRFPVGTEYRYHGSWIPRRARAAEQIPNRRDQAEQAFAIIFAEFSPVRLTDDVVQNLGGFQPAAFLAQN